MAANISKLYLSRYNGSFASLKERKSTKKKETSDSFPLTHVGRFVKNFSEAFQKETSLAKVHVLKLVS
jgi:hypothetical protein